MTWGCEGMKGKLKKVRPALHKSHSGPWAIGKGLWMSRRAAELPPRHCKHQDHRKRQRGAAAVEFAIILPVLLFMLLGVVDFGVFFGQNISLQSAAREGARQGITQGPVITSTEQARGLLDNSKLQIAFKVDTSSGAPGNMVVCVRYPQSSLTGFFAFALNGVSQAKTVMRMEGTATVASGQNSNWSGGTCSL